MSPCSFNQSRPPCVTGRPRSKPKQSCLHGLLFKHQASWARVQLITLSFSQIDDNLLKENWKEISGTLIFSLWTQDNEAWLNELVSNLSLMTLIRHSYLITGSCRRTHNPKCAFRSTGRLNNARKISGLSALNFGACRTWLRVSGGAGAVSNVADFLNIIFEWKIHFGHNNFYFRFTIFYILKLHCSKLTPLATYS